MKEYLVFSLSFCAVVVSVALFLEVAIPYKVVFLKNALLKLAATAILTSSIVLLLIVMK